MQKQSLENAEWEVQKPLFAFSGYADILEERSPCVQNGGSLSEETRERIRSLCLKLRKNDPIRNLAEAALNGEPVSEVELLCDTVMQTSRGKWRQCQLAALLLGIAAVSKDQKTGIADILCRVIENKMKRKDLIYSPSWLVAFIFNIVFGTFVMGQLLNNAPLQRDGFFWAPFLEVLLLIGTIPISMLMFILSLFSGHENRNQIRAAALDSLGKLQVPGTVGTVVAAIYRGYGMAGSPMRGPAPKAALRALFPVMAALSEEDYGRVPSLTVPDLCNLLGTLPEEYELQILEALKKIGDTRAVWHIEKMRLNTRSKAILSATTDLLTVLKARRQNEKEGRILLRPAEQLVQKEMLLRPVENLSETSREELLRSSALSEALLETVEENRSQA